MIYGNSGFSHFCDTHIHAVPLLYCISVSSSGEMLTITLDHPSRTLSPSQLTVVFTHNSTRKEDRRPVDANNLMIALAHGDLDPGSYIIGIEATNNVGSSFTQCQEHIVVKQSPGGMCM